MIPNTNKYRQSTSISKYQTRISSSGSIQKELLGPIKLAHVLGSDKKQPECHKKFFGAVFLYEVGTSKDEGTPGKRSKAGHCKNLLHCLLGSPLTLSKHPVSASAKYPLRRQLPEKTSHDTTESLKKPEISTSHSWITAECEMESCVVSWLCGVNIVVPSTDKKASDITRQGESLWPPL